MTNPDKSNGYEEVAPIFIGGRGRDGTGIGASAVAEWSKTLIPGATVLDLGCGPGRPISQVFIEQGFKVYGVDASPSMVAAFRTNFPGIPVECAAVEESNFFGRQFDAVVSWGLFFLLKEEVQRQLIAKVGRVLPSGGKFLFTAPTEACCWNDAMTDQVSLSLGYEAYRDALEAASLSIVGTHHDEGENHYYFAQKK